MIHLDLENLFDAACKTYYDYTPPAIKKSISPIIFFIKFRILSRIKNLYLPIYLVRGKEKSKKENITLLFLGDNLSYYYIADQLFFEEPQREFIRNIFIWKVHKYLKHRPFNVDAVFVKTDRFFSRFLQKKRFIIIPAWIELKMDISQPLGELYKNFKKSAFEDIRLIKKNGYTYEITNDPIKFEYFFHRLRLPYLSQRLGKLAIPATTNYEETRDIFHRSKLLLVRKEDEILSGFFLVRSKDRCHACYMGIAEPSRYLSKGAGTAPYYFSILWGKENNINLLDFGNNRSFLNDGSFQYKRKWGSSVSISKRFFDIFGFKIYNFKSKAIHSLLTNNPLTYIDKNQLNGIVFLQDLITYDKIKKIHENYYTPGLKKLFVITLNGDLKKIIKIVFEKDMKDVRMGTFDDIKYGIEPISGAMISYQNENIDIATIMLNTNFSKEKDFLKKRREQQMRFAEEYKLNAEQIKQIQLSDYEKNFERFIKQFPEQKNVILGTFLNTFAMFRRDGIDLKKISDKMLTNVFSALSDGKYDEEAIPEILRYLIKHNTDNIDESMDACGLYVLNETEITQIIREVIAQRKEFIKQHGLNAHDPLMGIIMEKLRGKANGETISQLLKKEIQRSM